MKVDKETGEQAREFIDRLEFRQFGIKRPDLPNTSSKEKKMSKALEKLKAYETIIGLHPDKQELLKTALKAITETRREAVEKVLLIHRPELQFSPYALTAKTKAIVKELEQGKE